MIGSSGFFDSSFLEVIIIHKATIPPTIIIANIIPIIMNKVLFFVKHDSSLFISLDELGTWE